MTRGLPSSTLCILALYEDTYHLFCLYGSEAIMPYGDHRGPETYPRREIQPPLVLEIGPSRH